MKLYILKRRDDDIGYDEAIAFVVRAPDESAARNMASKESGDEGPVNWLEGASCEELTADGEATVIVRSYRAG